MTRPTPPLALRRHVTATPTPDGMVLLDQLSGTYWQINATAALVVRALVAGASAEEAAAALTAAHPSAADRAAADVAAIVQQLDQARLIEPGLIEPGRADGRDRQEEAR
ncbi:lasso peptide biosynthesis PqqD family chaperone [Streptacidiphilus sp. EB129]|uniref:lasso peptide biosynthesis PqqD family chaperone n=1 Tax=Streptacidiphilus sp. EB129 TaxID=3156262 RepID=UPI0035191AE9